MFTCRGGHLRIYQQRKSWGKIEAEHFAYLHANFSHGVQKMLFALGELLPFRRACENFAPSAKSSWWFLKNSSSRSLTSHPMRKNTGYANPLRNPLVIIFENDSSRSSNLHPLRISTGFSNSKFTLRIKFVDHFFRTPTLRKLHFANNLYPSFFSAKKQKKKGLHLSWNPSKVLGVYGESLWSLVP